MLQTKKRPANNSKIPQLCHRFIARITRFMHCSSGFWVESEASFAVSLVRVEGFIRVCGTNNGRGEANVSPGKIACWPYFWRRRW